MFGKASNRKDIKDMLILLTDGPPDNDDEKKLMNKTAYDLREVLKVEVSLFVTFKNDYIKQYGNLLLQSRSWWSLLEGVMTSKIR